MLIGEMVGVNPEFLSSSPVRDADLGRGSTSKCQNPNLDALLGDWDLNIVKSKFEPSPPMKKYTMKVIDAGRDHLLIKSDWIDSDGTVGHVEYSTAFDGTPFTLVDYPASGTDLARNTRSDLAAGPLHDEIVGVHRTYSTRKIPAHIGVIGGREAAVQRRRNSVFVAFLQ